MPVTEEKKYKVLIVGDAGVGKTSYIKRLSSGEFIKRYIPTFGCEIHSLILEEKNVCFDVYDFAGQEKLFSLEDAQYIGASGAIVMYSVDSRVSFKSIKHWIQKLNAFGIKNIIVCGNKVELQNRSKEEYEYIHDYSKCLISVKNGINLMLPFDLFVKNI